MIPQLTFYYWLTCAELALTPKHLLRGVPVRLPFIAASDHPAVLEKLDEALRILEAANPRPRRLWGTYIRRAIVWRTTLNLASSYAPLKLCHLSLQLFDDSPLDIASVLVHEAQHLRLTRLGAPSTKHNRLRSEANCLRTEIDFLATHSEGGPVRISREAMLANIPKIWDLDARRLRGLDDLKRLGVPPWFLRAVDYLARKRAV
jgi:hypothetical protein